MDATNDEKLKLANLWARATKHIRNGPHSEHRYAYDLKGSVKLVWAPSTEHGLEVKVGSAAGIDLTSASLETQALAARNLPRFLDGLEQNGIDKGNVINVAVADANSYLDVQEAAKGRTEAGEVTK